MNLSVWEPEGIPEGENQNSTDQANRTTTK